MSPMNRFGLPLALIALAGLASSASAQIVKDGGFEAADPGQTTQTDYFTAGTPFDLNWAITGEVGIDNKDTFVYGGNKSLFLNYGTAGMDSISQNLATNANDFYTLSFYANDDTPGDVLNVSFGQTMLAPITVPANGFDGPDGNNKKLFTLYTFTGLTTTSPFTGLSFSSDGSLANGSLELDGIKVTSSPVPEASTSLSLGFLLMLGLGGAAWTAKKKAGVKSAAVTA